MMPRKTRITKNWKPTPSLTGETLPGLSAEEADLIRQSTPFMYGRDWAQIRSSGAENLRKLTEEEADAVLRTIEIKWPAAERPARRQQFLPELERSINSYLVCARNLDKPKPREIVAALQRVAKTSRTLSIALRDMDVLSEMALERTAFANQPPKAGLAGLTWVLRLRSEIGELSGFAETAASIVAQGRPGRPFNLPLFLLVYDLAVAWEDSTGETFSRSRNRDSAVYFVTAVANAVDPWIGEGAIDEAMKAVVKKKRKESAAR